MKSHKRIVIKAYIKVWWWVLRYGLKGAEERGEKYREDAKQRVYDILGVRRKENP